ncbi:hypothetical protein CLRAG_23810 [Clostridium ragsdalei P11]|uniref:Uncharacterized protein n=1 Tax=Clostridium ragsdalei P11 TaxID=1353534 RepID=A0A1A6ARL6_9CLOT|nr:ABC-three component system middle component 1 [Clostridium ragsdalei]OBR92675.1 hypothetical protein CLRAG_23810 [Clostridium ragsdalei P11]
MNKFEMIIREILIELGYTKPKKIDLNADISINIYKSENKTETQYYVVSTCNQKYFENADFDELQILVYKGIKELIVQEPAVDKNTSWIIGIECKDNYDNIMNKILSIEENPYYFKKMLCPYLTKEVSEFSDEIKCCSNYIEYMMQETKKVSRFAAFHDGKDSAYDLLMRLLIKLPIIKLKIEKENDLRSLADDIKLAVQEKGLNEIYEFLKEDIEKKTNMIDDNINDLHDLYYREDEKNE